MNRALLSIFIFGLILLIQISFIASLPWPLKTIPLLFALSLLRVQHQAILADAWWIAGAGIGLDLLGISTVPFPIASVSFTIVAIVVVALTRSVFSTRSWYGLMLCGLSACSALALSQAILLFLSTLTSEASVDWSSWGRSTIWQSIFVLLILMITFSASLSMRRWVRPGRIRSS